jgi:hypothetical protein
MIELHDHLLAIVKRSELDYEPYGKVERTGFDCSCGCDWRVPLMWLKDDWLICANPESHRCGLLTFEHQGCSMFVETNYDKYFKT